MKPQGPKMDIIPTALVSGDPARSGDAAAEGMEVETLSLSAGSLQHLLGPGEAMLSFELEGRRRLEALPEGRQLVAGRSPTVDVALESAGLSRQHARFEHSADGVWVTDLASRNGTFVQGKRIDRVRLKPGDVVTLGDVKVLAFLPPTGSGAARRETPTLAEYLANMGETAAFVRRVTGSPLADVKVFLIHHLTAEVLGVIAALRALGCKDLETLFVVYAGDTPEEYLTALRQVPADELHCLALTNEPSPDSVEGRYRLSARYARLEGKEEIVAALAREPRRYVDAMRAVAMLQFFRQLARAEALGQRCLVIEDGGYLSPLLNRGAIEDRTVGDLLRPYNPAIQDDRPVRAVLDGRFIGSIEHTRSGYERLADVEREHGRLFAPAISIAMSEYKVQTEAKDVVATVVNAVENILHIMGRTLSRRHCLVVGSRGVVGERLVASMLPRLTKGPRQICGVDPKVADDPKGPFGIVEAVRFDQLPARVRARVDLVLGVVGRSAFSGEDLELWLLESEHEELRLASGSSKTDEFSALSSWLDVRVGAPSLTIGGHPATVSSQDIVDPKTDGVVAQRFSFQIDRDGTPLKRSVVMMANGMPVNFLYYGVPTETIDGVLCQLLRSSLHLMDAHAGLSPHLYAVDVDISLPESEEQPE